MLTFLIIGCIFNSAMSWLFDSAFLAGCALVCGFVAIFMFL